GEPRSLRGQGGGSDPGVRRADGGGDDDPGDHGRRLPGAELLMATVRGCRFPEDRFYDVPHHVWYLPLGDGLVRAGMTPVGVALAREVLIFTPKRVGRPVEAGRAMATVESAKWVGSVRAGFAARVEAVNEALA